MDSKLVAADHDSQIHTSSDSGVTWSAVGPNRLWTSVASSADGSKLAARMWIPEDAEDNPVPALLEYLPYRKRDGTFVRDALTHPDYAGHGYASIRVDMRRL